MTCTCAATHFDTTKPLVEALGNVRERCLALKELLAPDDVWPVIVADAANPNSACHRSYLLLAYERGCLFRITGPVHSFLFESSRLHSKLTEQYRRDLQERWLLETDAVARHERFRRFLGKIVELQIADWLAGRDWKVTGLEALGAPCDVEGSSPEQQPYSIEVKYIGQRTDDFRDVVDALAGRPGGGGSRSPYGAVNYLLFRVYEAALSLCHCTGSKIAAVVIDAQAWYGLDLPLKDRWLNWKMPSFLPTEEEDWNEFLRKQRDCHPAIDSELQNVVRKLERVWIMKLNSGYEYSLEHEYRLAG